MHSTNTLRAAAPLAVLIALCAASGCRHVAAVDADAGTDTNPELNLAGVDLLVVIDNSISMSQEQAILATDLFAFVGSLVSPLPTSAYSAIDDLRIAVVTSDMGLSSDGVNNDAYWPGDVPPSCVGFGDNGEFQTISVSSVELTNDVVACDDTAAQCPPGWTCENTDGDGVGVCHTGGDTLVGCPNQTMPWLETTPEDPDPNIAARAACLSVQGTGGCGFEQQLASAATGLARDDQSDFSREDALLAVLVVSDEEDCSMRDGQALFGEQEIQDMGSMTVNLACGRHPEHLFTPSYFYDAFVSLKQPGAVLFAAIVGVPDHGAPADACQGPGDGLGTCLAQDEMQLEEELVAATWFFRPACTRSVGETEVTRAYPGRRYVELANSLFGGMGYVYSICNEDWSPAFEAVGAKMAALVQ